MIARAWVYLDQSRDGTISLDEVDAESGALLQKFRHWAIKHFESVHSCFVRLDVDCTGDVSFSTFKTASKRFAGFSKADIDEMISLIIEPSADRILGEQNSRMLSEGGTSIGPASPEDGGTVEVAQNVLPNPKHVFETDSTPANKNGPGKDSSNSPNQGPNNDGSGPGSINPSKLMSRSSTAEGSVGSKRVSAMHYRSSISQGHLPTINYPEDDGHNRRLSSKETQLNPPSKVAKHQMQRVIMVSRDGIEKTSTALGLRGQLPNPSVAQHLQHVDPTSSKRHQPPSKDRDMESGFVQPENTTSNLLSRLRNNIQVVGASESKTRPSNSAPSNSTAAPLPQSSDFAATCLINANMGAGLSAHVGRRLGGVLHSMGLDPKPGSGNNLADKAGDGGVSSVAPGSRGGIGGKKKKNAQGLGAPKRPKKVTRNTMNYSDLSFLDSWAPEDAVDRHVLLMSNVEYFERAYWDSHARSGGPCSGIKKTFRQISKGEEGNTNSTDPSMALTSPKNSKDQSTLMGTFGPSSPTNMSDTKSIMTNISSPTAGGRKKRSSGIVTSLFGMEEQHFTGDFPHGLNMLTPHSGGGASSSSASLKGRAASDARPMSAQPRGAPGFSLINAAGGSPAVTVNPPPQDALTAAKHDLLRAPKASDSRRNSHNTLDPNAPPKSPRVGRAQEDMSDVKGKGNQIVNYFAGMGSILLAPDLPTNRRLSRNLSKEVAPATTPRGSVITDQQLHGSVIADEFSIGKRDSRDSAHEAGTATSAPNVTVTAPIVTNIQKAPPKNLLNLGDTNFGSLPGPVNSGASAAGNSSNTNQTTAQVAKAALNHLTTVLNDDAPPPSAAVRSRKFSEPACLSAMSASSQPGSPSNDKDQRSSTGFGVSSPSQAGAINNQYRNNSSSSSAGGNSLIFNTNPNIPQVHCFSPGGSGSYYPTTVPPISPKFNPISPISRAGSPPPGVKVPAGMRNVSRTTTRASIRVLQEIMEKQGTVRSDTLVQQDITARILSFSTKVAERHRLEKKAADAQVRFQKEKEAAAAATAAENAEFNINHQPSSPTKGRKSLRHGPSGVNFDVPPEDGGGAGGAGGQGQPRRGRATISNINALTLEVNLTAGDFPPEDPQLNSPKRFRRLESMDTLSNVKSPATAKRLAFYHQIGKGEKDPLFDAKKRPKATMGTMAVFVDMEAENSVKKIVEETNKVLETCSKRLQLSPRHCVKLLETKPLDVAKHFHEIRIKQAREAVLAAEAAIQTGSMMLANAQNSKNQGGPTSSQCTTRANRGMRHGHGHKRGSVGTSSKELALTRSKSIGSQTSRDSFDEGSLSPTELLLKKSKERDARRDQQLATLPKDDPLTRTFQLHYCSGREDLLTCHEVLGELSLYGVGQKLKNTSEVKTPEQVQAEEEARKATASRGGVKRIYSANVVPYNWVDIAGKRDLLQNNFLEPPPYDIAAHWPVLRSGGSKTREEHLTNRAWEGDRRNKARLSLVPGAFPNMGEVQFSKEVQNRKRLYSATGTKGPRWSRRDARTMFSTGGSMWSIHLNYDHRDPLVQQQINEFHERKALEEEFLLNDLMSLEDISGSDKAQTQNQIRGMPGSGVPPGGHILDDDLSANRAQTANGAAGFSGSGATVSHSNTTVDAQIDPSHHHQSPSDLLELKPGTAPVTLQIHFENTTSTNANRNISATSSKSKLSSKKSQTHSNFSSRMSTKRFGSSKSSVGNYAESNLSSQSQSKTTSSGFDLTESSSSCAGPSHNRPPPKRLSGSQRTTSKGGGSPVIPVVDPNNPSTHATLNTGALPAHGTRKRLIASGGGWSAGGSKSSHSQDRCASKTANQQAGFGDSMMLRDPYKEYLNDTKFKTSTKDNLESGADSEKPWTWAERLGDKNQGRNRSDSYVSSLSQEGGYITQNLVAEIEKKVSAALTHLSAGTQDSNVTSVKNSARGDHNNNRDSGAVSNSKDSARAYESDDFEPESPPPDISKAVIAAATNPEFSDINIVCPVNESDDKVTVAVAPNESASNTVTPKVSKRKSPSKDSRKDSKDSRKDSSKASVDSKASSVGEVTVKLPKAKSKSLSSKGDPHDYMCPGTAPDRPKSGSSVSESVVGKSAKKAKILKKRPGTTNPSSAQAGTVNCNTAENNLDTNTTSNQNLALIPHHQIHSTTSCSTDLALPGSNPRPYTTSRMLPNYFPEHENSFESVEEFSIAAVYPGRHGKRLRVHEIRDMAKKVIPLAVLPGDAAMYGEKPRRRKPKETLPELSTSKYY